MNKHTAMLTIVWASLLVLTLFSALIAERVELTDFVVLVICGIVMIKGSMVIERLMGLRRAKPVIRWLMLSYFFILPPLIALAVIFPEGLARITTL